MKIKKLLIVVGVLLLLTIISFSTLGEKPATKTDTLETSLPADSTKVFELDGISIRVPQTWLIDTYDTGPDFIDSEGNTPLFYVTKPDLSNEYHPPDAPTQNMVMIDFRTMAMEENLDTAGEDIVVQLSGGYLNQMFIIENDTVDGVPAIFMYKDLDEQAHIKAEYPSYIIFKSSPSKAVIASIDFFNVGDEEYTMNTIEEINKAINTLSINQ